ncbi:MAG: MFS transporter [Candidatus Omnitrophica bacterium]|nr:MFS transporter [Candidatus Omnitrophota bacterium]
MFPALKIKSFRLYWLGMSVSLVGTWIQIIAQSWLVFQLTGSSFLLGLVGFLGTIPIFLFSLLGGLIADRFNKRNILIITQGLFMILAFLLGALTQFRIINPFQIMILVTLNGVVMAFDGPSRQAIVVEMVGNKNLLNAIALNSISFNASRVIGPALAGILASLLGLSGCFYINAISFLAVLSSLFLVRLDKNKFYQNKKSLQLQELKQCFIFIKNNHYIILLISIVAVLSIFGFSYNVLMPVFADNVLKVGLNGLGILMSANGLGALLAGLFLAKLGDFKKKETLLKVSCFLFSIFLILFSISRIYPFCIFLLIFMGASSLMIVALVNTLLQIQVGDNLRGRLMGIFMLILVGFMPFGNLLGGWLSYRLGISSALFLGGVICLLFYIIIIKLMAQR